MKNKILKFRAWDGLNKKFTYWTMNDLCTYAEKDEKPSALDAWQQDIGLLDHCKKEIYVGDILDFENGYIDEIISQKGQFKTKTNVYVECLEHGRVIGNIHENPELLTNQNII